VPVEPGSKSKPGCIFRSIETGSDSGSTSASQTSCARIGSAARPPQEVGCPVTLLGSWLPLVDEERVKPRQRAHASPTQKNCCLPRLVFFIEVKLKNMELPFMFV